MMSCVGEGHEQGGELGTEDAFDRRLSDIFDAEEDLLREQAVLLLATGSISIERSAGTVAVQFRRPVWRRRPEIHLDAVPADDSGRHAGMHGPMVSKYGDRAALIREIMLALAVHLAWLEDDE
jgi:hypothetical protein